MKKRIRYIFVATLIAFLIWLAGELILMFRFPDSGLTAARIWAIAVVVFTCIWNLLHFYRAAKKQREEKKNEEYKSVY
jgi:type VI protein secretion system component VasK